MTALFRRHEMKNIQPCKTSKYLKLFIYFIIVGNLQARSPAVLPVRGLEMPHSSKKYLDGPANLNKTSFHFDKGTANTLIAIPDRPTYLAKSNEKKTTIVIAFSGAFSLISPFLYFIFFRRKKIDLLQSTSIHENDLSTIIPNNISQITRAEKIKENHNIRKVS